MDNPTYIALSRQSGLMKEMEVVANNIANANTVGYRGEYTLFQEYLARTGTIGHRELVSFTQDVGQYRSSSDGPLQTTGGQFDLALRGNGYFALGDPAGQIYARTGEFHADGQGRVTSSEGFPLLLEGGQPLIVDSGAGPVDIAKDGTVRQANQTLGKLELATFGDQGALRRSSNGFYNTDQAPLPAADATVVQGALEGSNVSPVLEVTRMLNVARSYDATQRMIEAENTRKTQTNQKLAANN